MTRRVKYIKLDTEQYKNLLNIGSYYDNVKIQWQTVEQISSLLEEIDILKIDENIADTKLVVLDHGEGYIIYEGSDLFYHLFIS